MIDQNGSSPTPKFSLPKSYLTITWMGMDRYVSQMADEIERVRGKNAFDVVIGIARGGMIPACLLARKLNVPHIRCIEIKSYDDVTMKAFQEPVCTTPAMDLFAFSAVRCLVVDDILDTGRTITLVRKMLPKAVTCVLLAKRKALENTTVDIIGQILSTESTWVVFPWEKSQT